MTWAIPALLAIALGTIGITRQAWRDEHATWHAATMPVAQLREYLSHTDIVFAPYYLFMRAWMAVFGDSVVAMRIPSVLAMAAAAGLVGVLGAQLFDGDRWIGIAAGTLFAVLPSVSRYSAEARPYPFAIAFAILTILAVLRRHWIVLGWAVALTGLCHLLALLILLAHVPIVVHDKTSRRPWAVAVGIGLLPVVPIAVLGLGQTHQVDWIESGLRAAGTLPMNLFKSAVVAGIFAALAGVAILSSRWDWRIVTLVTWAAAPPLVLFTLAPDVFYYRYLLFTLPAWTILAALALPRRMLALPAVLALVMLLGARDHLAVRKSPLPGDQDYRAAAAYVGDRFAPGDRLFFSGYADGREKLGFAYELRRRAAPPECISCLDSASRLWLVTNGSPTPVPGFEQLESIRFPGVTVTLLQRA